MVVTRMAPSPTGMMHIGTARTALYNYLFAKNQKGKFRLRIEDTDLARNVEGGVDVIINGFKWLGLVPDDEIVYQMQNQQRHLEVANELLRQGKAYYCYTSQEELQSLREEAEKEKKVFKFRSPWRDAKPEDAPKGVKPAIRIKAPLEGGVSVYDVLQGDKTVPADALDDFIIVRSDGVPTYMLAVVVDDHDMGVSHVIRGNEHYNNAFRQKLIFDAMGWEAPVFCHIPLILGSDKTKLSKRHGAASIMEYKTMGYLPEAINNYLLRLGWSHGDDEIISMSQAIEWFNLEHLQKSPAIFDFDKLNSLNKYYIKIKDDEELFNLAFENEATEDYFRARCLKAMATIKDRATVLTDVKNSCLVYVNGWKKEIVEKDMNFLQTHREMLETLLPEIAKIGDWSTENIKEQLKSVADAKDWKMRDWTQVLRIKLTFASVSAGGVFEIMEILGKEESLKRLND